MFVISDCNLENESSIFVNDKDNLRILYPPKKKEKSFGSFHPKIMLIRFKGKLRVVIGSGNMSSGDWMFWSNCYVKMDFQKVDQVKSKLISQMDEKILKKRNDFINVEHPPKDSQRIKSIVCIPSHPFTSRVHRYLSKIQELGYTFKNYLSQYLKISMADKLDQLKNFLGIDFDDYDLTQNELFLVGSLPGAFDNHINYSSKKLLQMGIHKYMVNE